MSVHEVPQPTPNPRLVAPLDLPRMRPGICDLPNHREVHASKKVDDISRHESKHGPMPKLDPKFNAREKVPGVPKPQDEKPLPGTVKK